MDTKDQINANEKLVTVHQQEVATRDFKSMFYQMTAKPDSTTKVFPKDVVIELNDIFVLNDRVVEKLRSHYNDAGFLVSISVKYSNGKINAFSSWDLFEGHKWYESESISNIVMVWEFNAVLPQYNVPQKHTLTVRMSNSMRPEELLNIIFTGNMNDLEEIDKNFFPVVARVDFIDRILGDELLNLVLDWNRGLKESAIQRPKYMVFLKKHKSKVVTLLNYCTNFILVACAIALSNRYIRSLNISSLGNVSEVQLIGVFNAVFICAAIWALARKVVESITDIIFNQLRDYGESCLFSITNGDRNKQIRLQKRECQNKRSVVLKLIMTLVWDVFCSIIISRFI